MVIKELNSVVASCPKFILEICFPNISISAARFLFSLSAILCVLLRFFYTSRKEFDLLEYGTS